MRGPAAIEAAPGLVAAEEHLHGWRCRCARGRTWRMDAHGLPPSRLRQLGRRARTDPVWFNHTIIGGRLWKAQCEILRDLWRYDQVAVKSCNGIGKSYLAARAVITYGSTRPGALILTTATTFTQVVNILWREVGKNVRDSQTPLGCEVLQTSLKWPHGSYAFGLTAPDYDASKMQGYRAADYLIIIDEAAGISNEMWEGLMSMTTGEGSKVLAIGNPTNPHGRFAAAFKSTSWRKHSISAFDTPNLREFGIVQEDIESGAWRFKQGKRKLPMPHLVTPNWVAKTWDDCGRSRTDPRYMARVLAQFPTESNDSLIPFWQVEAAQQRSISGRIATEPIELGVDVARHGEDSSVIVLRVGAIAQVAAKFHGMDTMKLCGAVKRICEERGASMVKVDEIGVGAGVVDRLTELGLPVVGVNVASSSSNTEKYANLKAEIFWGLRERFESGDIVLDGDTAVLGEQLSALRWAPTSRGQIRIESKKDSKARGEESPDEADALALAFYNTDDRRFFFM